MFCLALILLAFASPAAEAQTTTLGFVGDVSFAGRADEPADVFANVRAALSMPDFVVANAEGLLLAKGAPTYREARLDISASPRYAAAFRDSGVDLIGLANNHSWDAGAAGVTENKGHFVATAIPQFGAGESAFAPVRHDSPSGCISFVPATLKSNRRPQRGAEVAYYGDRGARPISALYALIAAERAAGCLPIAFVHWGREGKPMPERTVISIAYALVDAGAAAVIGHHPHVLQGVAWRDGPNGRAPIAWSLGNFVFKNRDPDKRRTGLLALDVRDSRVSNVRLVPMTIDQRTFAPRPATPAEAAQHARTLAERSAPFGTKVTLVDGVVRFD